MDRKETLEKIVEMLNQANDLQQEVLNGPLSYKIHTELTNLAEKIEELI